ncbi:MAG TPA: hypothetical protein VGB83_02205 [Actinomycetota bacterium]
MRRRTFDILMSAGGLVLTIALVVAGALLMVGYNFASTNVTNELTAQNIFFPPAGSEALASDEIGPYLNKYAGQQLTTGEQAKAYADHFIGVHLKDVADGKTYAEVSTLSRANPDDAVLAGQVQTLFRGETLRGLLLNAYAFWQFGQIAKIAGIASFGLAGVMAILTILGFWHLRRVAPEEEVLAPRELHRKTA